jgi:hypothetical protein
LDETLRMADSARQDRKGELKRQWPFLQSICNGGWFKPLLFGQPPKLKSVCDEELDGGEKDRNWPLFPSSYRSDIEAKVTRFLEGSGPLPELISSRAIYDQIAQIKKQNVATPDFVQVSNCAYLEIVRQVHCHRSPRESPQQRWLKSWNYITPDKDVVNELTLKRAGGRSRTQEVEKCSKKGLTERLLFLVRLNR